MSAPVRESGEADHPFAPACDRREIDPASDVSRYLARPDHAQASRRVSTDLRNSGTPETALVRTHTSPDTKTARKLSLRAVDLRLYR